MVKNNAPFVKKKSAEHLYRSETSGEFNILIYRFVHSSTKGEKTRTEVLVSSSLVSSSLSFSLSRAFFSRKHRTLDKNTSGNFTRQTSWSRWSRKGNRGGGVGSDKSEHNRVCHQRTTRYCMINISPGRTLPSACWFNKFAFLFLPLCVCVCAFSSSLLSIRWTFCATIWYN